MCKLIKILTVFLILTANTAFAADNAPYLIKSFDKCSIQNECSDVIDSIRKIQVPKSEHSVLKLQNMIDINLQTSVIPVPDTPAYRLPEAVYEYPDEHIYNKSSFVVDIIDPRAGDPGVNSSYPGLRGTNQLVIYTPSFGIRTNTNEFGAEAMVVGNTVVKLSGADSVIPKDGFVISGHGRAKTWIQQNLILGSKIYFNPQNNQISSFVTPSTYIFEVKEKIKETSQVMQYYRMMDSKYDGRKASNYLYKANEFIRKAEKNAEKHFEKSNTYMKEAKIMADTALEYAVPYKKDEFKGIWIRPAEYNEKDIEKTVERLSEAGIKNVFLETFYHGQTIYPSEVLANYGVTSQRGEFVGFDPLEIWIKECHKNKIKVHIWFECFYVGNKPPRSSQKHILSVYPQWANTTKALAESSDIAYSVAEHNGYFIDPANPEVQKFVGDVLTEIIEKYHPDGINLDYIRYPQSAQIRSDNSTGTEWGYTQYARQEFMNLYGVDPLEIKVADPLRKKWFEYRQNKITDFVSFARNLTYKYSNVMLTTVVFPDRQRSLETKLQDWKNWSAKNLADGFTPLLLTTDKKTAGSLIRSMKSEMSPNTKIYPGLFVMFMNAPSDELLLQLHETRKMHADGLILFDYAHFYPKYEKALGVRAFYHKN